MALKNSMPQIFASDLFDHSYKLGILHAKYRLMQMVLLRIIGEGRICELLDDNEDNLQIDIYMRQMNFAGNNQEDLEKLRPESRKFIESYCDGVNEEMKKSFRPFEFILIGLKPEPWKAEDILLTVKMMSFIGLAQGQGDLERFIMQTIRTSSDAQALEKMQALFHPHLNEFSPEIIEKLKSLKYFEEFFSQLDLKKFSLPTLHASNNWALSSDKSKNGSPIFCYDPHLESTRLPAVWFEAGGSVGDIVFHGITMPGIPGLIMGRLGDLAHSFTYGFMDMMDFYIEEIQDEKHLLDGKYQALEKRAVSIKRKKNQDFTFDVYQTADATLESKPKEKLQDGLYLSRAWSGEKGAVKSVEALFAFFKAKDIHELKAAACEVSISCNWILANSQGNLYFAQSGLCPIRSHSGLHPIMGAEKQKRWCGFYKGSELSHYQIDKNFIATSNQDVTTKEGAFSINVSMGDYRQRRISELIQSKDKHDVEDMKKLQADIYSVQARDYLKIIAPLLPSHPSSEILRSWDFCYTTQSVGASLFELIYQEALKLTFSSLVGGEKEWKFLMQETAIIADYFQTFDKILLDPKFKDDPLWFPQGRDQLLKEAINNVFSKTTKISVWGELHQVHMVNIFFQGKLPKIFAFDHGPIPFPGSRCTVAQANLYRAHKRQTSFLPSFRCISEMKSKTFHSCLAGGVSASRFSSLYKSDLKRWFKNDYKKIDL
jgi:penicillin G amidase